MKVAIIDVGSNSVRLLVAAVDAGNVNQILRERVYLRLGDDAYRRGRIGSRKLEATRVVAAKYARIARKAGAERLETIVTAPGRQAENHEELVQALVKATRAAVVVLSGDDEGRLAWQGAVARMEESPRTVAVVDLGGGSCEVAVGDRAKGPVWVRSIEAGALRVTRAFLGGNPPDDERISCARARDPRSSRGACVLPGPTRHSQSEERRARSVASSDDPSASTSWRSSSRRSRRSPPRT